MNLGQPCRQPHRCRPIKLFLIAVREDSMKGHDMSATDCTDRALLDTALPYQVAVNLSDGDGDEGTLRKLYCRNLNIGPGHQSAVVHDIAKYIFCFANLRDANRFRSQFGGKLLDSSLRRARQETVNS